MAKVYKTVIVPAVPAKPETLAKVDDGIVCDLCGAKGQRGTHGTSGWSSEYDEIKQTTVSALSGRSYESGGHYTEQTVDICPQCFENKLRPWLEEQGAKFREIEHDW